ncbi:Xaa-pro aminopeptidase, putative (macronuclear) [Tetrahymena thermophila SB210]|uniref:Xaa-pro aminopeptidase, putative n=1 Tax=Tetrahymena thermophila (strain SB210) TaxID=312017 RepID=Q240Q4_TETTS|nr:Xaa-pro aminopeptidase, putative [Tetrahymena thermophila SB210]EAS02360.3 Xaa-pro aminopeptidase, putative [Tetrahymena thermophila SB210]|eukprot:XP_001022605.3 Xaa-pro aminopeptidase, putative [Tetrahymena thermophila SB210]
MIQLLYQTLNKSFLQKKKINQATYFSFCSTIMSQKLVQIRSLMAQHGLKAYLVPHDDQHSSEYIASSDERLAFISGFKGSAGLALISDTHAYLYTDSRYWIAASKQLEEGWELKKTGLGFKTWFAEAAEQQAGHKIGFDPLLIQADAVENRTKYFQQHNIQFVSVSENLVDAVWTDKPADSLDKIFRHEDKYVGQTAAEKIAVIGKELKNLGANYTLSAKLDEIAWILNLRGSDISFNPVFKAYLILHYCFQTNTNKGTLYINDQKVPEDIRQYLETIHIQIRPYTQIFTDVTTIDQKIAIHKGEVNYKILSSIPPQFVVEQTGTAIINRLKGVKTATQIQGFKTCNIRDGASLVSYLAWLEHELVVKKSTQWTEYTASQVLDNKRRANELNVGLSFDTISSTGPNGAVVHYRAEEATALTLNTNQIYLVDSGAQYHDGTTDTTRTVHFGTPTDEEKDAYTRVLLGNLDIQRVQWPASSRIGGSDIDALARKYLWQKGLDYGHGTGHGVGHFLNVHEGPHGISKFRSEPLVEGMIVTDEPGYYKEGHFGIRIEDDLVVVKKPTEGFLGFENLTLVPYDRNLIDLSLLTQADKDYINAYHQKVRSLLAPLLESQNDQIGLAYLNKKTAEL